MTEGESRLLGVVREMRAVEAQADVNALTFGGVCIWPIMRRIHHFSRAPQKDKKQPTTLAEIEDPAFTDFMIRADDGGFDRATDLERQKQVLAGNIPCDALFISRLLDHTDRVNGLYYNRLTDPYINAMRGQYQHLKLELSDKPVTELPDRFEPTVPLQTPPWQDAAYLKDMPTNVAGYGPVAEAFKKVSPLPPSFEQLTAYLPRLWSRRNYFLQLMRRLRPRVVFIVCYYSADMLALIWACRQLGIQTVDIQHGQKGPHHGMYSHWTVSPPEGYGLVADHFFTWGMPEKRAEEEGLPLVRLRPFSHVAGNPWIGLWREEKTFRLSDKLEEFCAGLKTRKTVLAGLQPGTYLLPDALPGAMRRTPDWLWLLRLHPHQRYRIQEVTAFLKAGGIENFEIEMSTKAPLYALFRNVNRLITQFSSVALEAAAFELPVTVIDPRGYDSYRAEIDSGVMSYALTPDEIAREVMENKPAAPAREVFIEGSLDAARAALAKVFD
jgi:hypothetical protein